MNQTFIIICADESKNAGERDYTFALMAELRARKEAGENVTTHLFKIPTADQGNFDDAKKIITQDAKNFRPENNSDYRNVPPVPTNMAEYLGADIGNVTVLGAGLSTLTSLTVIQSQLEEHDIDAEAGLIAHALDNENQMRLIGERNIRLFTPMTRENLRKKYDTLVDDIFLETTASVPHTNTLKSAQEHYDISRWVTDQPGFMRTHPLASVDRWQKNNNPFAIAIINAGFEIELEKDVKTWVPYTTDEAYAHGTALGAHLTKGTNLYAAEGGPRNARDRTPNGKDPTLEFIRGYMEAQGWGNTQAALERYDAAFDMWNPIKASYIMAQSPLCQAFISNAEGYGTMDGAILALDNKKLLVGMFPFAALYKDPSGSRQKNVEIYNQKGIAKLIVTPQEAGMSVDAHGQLVVQRHPNEIQTPLSAPPAAAVQIFDIYLGGDTPAPKPKALILT